MGLLERLLRRKPKSRPATPAPFPGNEAEQAAAARAAMGTLQVGSADRFPKLSDTDGSKGAVVAKAAPARVTKDAPTVNIWDIEDDASVDAPEKPSRADPVAADAPPRRRQNRAKTRMLGFEPQETSVVPLFDAGTKSEDDLETVDGPAPVMFPAGWLVVKQGAGRGATFPLLQGLSMIGRGNDQTVRLDFGDMAISRSNHASIAYDPTLHRFHIGHGGKSNLVRLNGRPLLSTEELREGDEIQVGETTLLMKVLCTPEFNWTRGQSGGDANDMAIA
jgi:FHA domain